MREKARPRALGKVGICGCNSRAPVKTRRHERGRFPGSSLFRVGAGGALLTDHVKATCVAEELHVFGGDLHVVVAEDAVGSVQESVKTGVGVQLAHHVEESHDHVVTASSLAAGEHAADLQGEGKAHLHGGASRP